MSSSTRNIKAVHDLDIGGSLYDPTAAGYQRLLSRESDSGARVSSGTPSANVSKILVTPHAHLALDHADPYRRTYWNGHRRGYMGKVDCRRLVKTDKEDVVAPRFSTLMYGPSPPSSHGRSRSARRSKKRNVGVPHIASRLRFNQNGIDARQARSEHIPRRAGRRTEGLERVAELCAARPQSKGSGLRSAPDNVVYTENESRCLGLLRYCVVGHKTDAKTQSARPVKPIASLGRSAGGVAGNERVVSIHQQRALTGSIELVQIDAIDRGHISLRGEERHDADPEYSSRSLRNWS